MGGARHARADEAGTLAQCRWGLLSSALSVGVTLAGVTGGEPGMNIQTNAQKMRLITRADNHGCEEILWTCQPAGQPVNTAYAFAWACALIPDTSRTSDMWTSGCLLCQWDNTSDGGRHYGTLWEQLGRVTHHLWTAHDVAATAEQTLWGLGDTDDSPADQPANRIRKPAITAAQVRAQHVHGRGKVPVLTCTRCREDVEFVRSHDGVCEACVRAELRTSGAAFARDLWAYVTGRDL